MRTVRAGLADCPARLAHLVDVLAVDVGQALLDHLLGIAVQLFEEVGRKVQPVFPVKAEPPDVVLNRVDVFDVFLRRIRVVEPQVALAVIFLSQSEVQADGLGVADVQITVGLGREPGVNAAVVFSFGQIAFDNLLDEVERSASVRVLVARLVCVLFVSRLHRSNLLFVFFPGSRRTRRLLILRDPRGRRPTGPATAMTVWRTRRTKEAGTTSAVPASDDSCGAACRQTCDQASASSKETNGLIFRAFRKISSFSA